VRPRADDGRTTALIRFCFGAGAELTRAEGSQIIPYHHPIMPPSILTPKFHGRDTGGPRKDRWKTTGVHRRSTGRPREDHMMHGWILEGASDHTGGSRGDQRGAREAKGGRWENYCSDTVLFRSRYRANKSRVTPNHLPPSPHHAPQDPATQSPREGHGWTTEGSLEDDWSSQEEHGKTTGGS
jgi:hypothetical protein